MKEAEAPERGCMTGALLPLIFPKGRSGGGGALFTKVLWVISWFINIELKQIYCSYSRTQKLQNGFV